MIYGVTDHERMVLEALKAAPDGLDFMTIGEKVSKPIGVGALHNIVKRLRESGHINGAKRKVEREGPGRRDVTRYQIMPNGEALLAPKAPPTSP